MEDFTLNINLALENPKSFQIACTRATTAESICLEVCKALNIGNLVRHLFALRLTNTSIYLAASSTFNDAIRALQTVPSVDFRMRYKVASISKLMEQDAKAYDYYYFQVRTDVLQCKVPGLGYDKCRKELLGLGITDMLRVMLEQGTPRQMVEDDYKKYVAKDILKKHSFFIKKPIHDTLVSLEKNLRIKPVLAGYVKAQYITEFESIAPEYLSEMHEAKMDRVQGAQSLLISMKVTPPHHSDPGISYYIGTKLDKKETPKWIKLCTIEDLGFIAIRDDGSVELSRLNGIPIYLRFKSAPLMLSFVSLLDGYYRLSCKWTFNLCQKLKTETLTKLYSIKCHGPVGGQFSYAKLESKTANEVGCYIIRESETSFTTYYIDLCVKNNPKPKTLKLYQVGDGFRLEDDPTVFPTVRDLIKAYDDPDGEIYFRECVPPSDYDVSQLLLCRKPDTVGESLADSSDLLPISSSPVCISCKDLQVFKGQRLVGARNISHVYKGMWKATKGQKIEVALKFLNEGEDKYLKEYMNEIGQWSFLNSSALVRYFGICFSLNSVGPVMEYFKYGPLDQYLKANKSNLKIGDLIEASSCLASAIWHLNENNVVHGRVRCRKLMVHKHEDAHFTVKLTDCGVFTPYTAEEIHWIPLECYLNLNEQSPSSDIWAMATTLFEIFTWGEPLPLVAKLSQNMKWYRNGNRLPRPADCPPELYRIMTECWNADPHLRKHPQEISRDVNQLLYQVFTERPKVTYNYLNKPSRGSSQTIETNLSTDGSTYQLLSDVIKLDMTPSSTEGSPSGSSQRLLLDSPEGEQDSGADDSSNESTEDVEIYWSNYEKRDPNANGLAPMQCVYELEGAYCSYNVNLQGRLGQGYYGEVYQGYLEDVQDCLKPRINVAVKKLKDFAQMNFVKDFEREIKIMQALKHPNIVEILDVVREPDLLLVMEFVPHGSLQSYLNFNKDNLVDRQLLKFAYDIAQGMDYLGEMHIVHRDLAARNILVVDHTNVKISDFGLAQFLDSNDYYILRSYNRNLPVKWYAPESLTEGKFSTRSDVWSFGVTLFEMYLFGQEPPFLGGSTSTDNVHLQTALLNAIVSGERYPCPDSCAQSVYVNLMHPCWDLDPHARPTFKELIKKIMVEMENC